MYLVTVLIVKAMELKREGKTLGALIADLKDPLESAEIRLNITEPDSRKAGEAAIRQVTAYAQAREDWHIAPDNREGIRISFDLDGEKDAGWFLLRLSVHDPVMPINAESDREGGVRRILSWLRDALEGAKGLETGTLDKAAGRTV